MLVSFVVPAYNVEEYIGTCLTSLLNQTDRDFEIIIVDDGSTDKTYEIAHSILKSSADVKWKLLKQENKGVSVARNVGMSMASGRYIVFVDSDDCVSESLVEKIRPIVNRCCYDIVIWKYTRRTKTGNLIIEDTEGREDDGGEYRGPQFLLKMLKEQLKVGMWSCAYKREYLMRTGLIFKAGAKYGEDLEFLYKALFMAGKVFFIDDRMYYYTIREGSATTTLKDLSTLQHITWPNRVISFIEQNRNVVGSDHNEIENIRKQLDLVRLDRLFSLSFTMITVHDFMKRNMRTVRNFLRNAKIRRELNLALKVIKGKSKHKLVVGLVLTLALFPPIFFEFGVSTLLLAVRLKRFLKDRFFSLSRSE